MKKGEKQSWARNGIQRRSKASRFRHPPRCEGYLSEKIKNGWIGRRRILTPIREIVPSFRESADGEDFFVTIKHGGQEKHLVDTEQHSPQFVRDFTMWVIGLRIVSAFRSTACAMNDLYPCETGMGHMVCLCAIATPRQKRIYQPWDGGAVICSIGSGSLDEFRTAFYRRLGTAS